MRETVAAEEMVEGYRLSTRQRSLWALGLDGGEFRAQCSVLLEGPLDVAALQSAVGGAVARHQILRTGFRRVLGVKYPVQVVHDEAEPEWRQASLRHLPADEQAGELERQFELEKESAFDYGRASLLRLSLFTLSEDRHALFISLPALCADARSLSSLMSEVGRSYAEALRGEAPAGAGAAEETTQYVQFSEWQHELPDGEEAAAASAYWREFLSDRPAEPVLPFEAAPGTEHTPAPASVITRLDADLTARLEQASLRHGATLADFLFACWQTFLWRMTGQADVLTCRLSDGRRFDELEEALGPFALWLPARSRFYDNSRLGEVLAVLRRDAAEAADWQEFPVWEGDGGEAPRPSIGFDFTEIPAPQEHGGLRLSMLKSHTLLERFKLSLSCTREAVGLHLALRFDPSRFSLPSARRLSSSLLTFISSAASLVADPECRISALPLLDERQRRRLLSDLNDTASLYTDSSLCLHHLFERQAASSPLATALSSLAHDGSLRHTSYSELDRLASLLTSALHERGAGCDSTVALLFHRSESMVASILGALKAGAAFLPLDPELPEARLRLMLAASRARLVLTEGRLAGLLRGAEAEVLEVEPLLAQAGQGEPQPAGGQGSGEHQAPGAVAHPESLAYVIFTSGSTGRPKGVGIPHSAIVNHMLWMCERFPLSPSDCVLQKTPYSFDASVWEFFLPLISGARLGLAPAGAHRDPRQLAEAARRCGATVMQCVPALWRALAEEGALGECGGRVRLAFSGGEALTRSLAEGVRAGLGGAEVVNLYGPTEATIDASYEVYGGASEAVSEAVARSGQVPIGSPVGNVRLYVLDGGMGVVPEGVEGELYIGGAGLGRGYVGEAGQTAERFVPDGLSGERGGRLYRTGDVVRRVEGGRLEYVGRADGQVKVRGQRIELGEVEAVLSAHAGVRDCVVVVRRDEKGVGGEPILVAYVVPAKGHHSHGMVEELRRHLRESLPEYMIPAQFVALDELPHTSSGKIDRRRLPAPEDVESHGRGESAAPRGPVEEMVARSWAEVLKLDRVGVHDNFFELGGHSLLATQVLSRIRSSFHLEVTLRDLFDAPTVAGLARRIEAQFRNGTGEVSAPPLRRAARTGPLPLSFAQQRLWFLDQITPGSAAYNMPVAVRLRGPLDARALARSLSELVARHEALRTHFDSIEGVPVQVVGPPPEVRIEVEDLAIEDEAERDGEAARLALDEARRPFDLRRGPLWRARLLRLSEEEHVLLLTMHHIVCDGWSIGVLVRELGVLYEAFTRGEESPLSELPLQYADYSVWQREWLRGETLERQLAYWRERLAGAPSLEIQTDYPRTAWQTFHGAEVSAQLPAESLGALHELSRREGVTLFMTLLAAWQALLSRYSGQHDVSVGVPVAGRRHEETEQLAGVFVNTLVVRSDLRGDPSFAELLGRVREAALGAYAHQDMPFEKLVEELQPERDPSRSPLFQVMFSMQNTPAEVLKLGEVEAGAQQTSLSVTKFDLTLVAAETGDGLQVRLEYNTGLYAAETGQTMLRHFIRLLEGAAARPERPLSSLPLLGEGECDEILRGWNRTAADYPRDACLHELFEAQVGRDPDAPAIVRGAEAMTYGELNRRANQLARRLRDSGVGPEVTVGVCAEHSPEVLVALLAVLKAGGRYLPLDPDSPPQRTALMLEDAGAAVLLTRRELAPAPGAFDGRTFLLDADWGEVAGLDGSDLTPAAGPANTAYVIYTSGSTGRPKGVMVSHRSAVNYVWWAKDAYLRGERLGFALYSSLAFDLTITSIYVPLLTGNPVHLYPPDGPLPPVADILREGKAGVVKLTPGHLALLSGQDWRASGVRRLIVGGEALETGLARQIWEAFGGRVELYNEYGPTEATVGCMIHRFDPDRDRRAFVPVGRGAANARLYVLGERLEPVPDNVVGELYIGGDCLATGYLGRGGLTAERFIPDPFAAEPGGRLYRTGDLARRLRGGDLDFLGRRDQQVKVRGYRVELGEVEAALSAHAGVRACAVEARAGEGVSGSGATRLVAYVVPEGGALPNAGELRRHLHERLPAYMVPSEFVPLAELPLTPRGKIDRRRLPAPCEASAADHDVFVPPRTPTEEALARIWRELLGVERVGAFDNFFERGGHSLLAAQLVYRVRESFAVEAPLQAIFETPALDEYARLVDDLGSGRAPARREFGVEDLLAEVGLDPAIRPEATGDEF